jgi:hypothetical protein
MKELNDFTPAQSCRVIQFEEAEVHPGIVGWILVVRGNKPYMNMNVELVPLIYIQQPEYWGIEVVGRLNGMGLPAITPYTVSIPLDSITGSKGIEVMGQNKTQKFNIPPTEQTGGS